MLVRLSRRNLLTLLAKLEICGSSCTIIKPDGTAVVAEPDEIHYVDRCEPGEVTEETEARMTGITAAIEALRRLWESYCNQPSLDDLFFDRY